MDSCLSGHEEMVRDRQGWRVAAHGVTKGQTRLSEQKQQGHVKDTFLQAVMGN